MNNNRFDSPRFDYLVKQFGELSEELTTALGNIDSSLDNIDSSIENINTNVTDLEERVTALEPRDYSTEYFTTEALESGTIQFNIWYSMGTDYITSISYKKNNDDWITINNTDNKEANLEIPVTVETGDIVKWKGTAVQTGFYSESDDEDLGSFFSSTCQFNVCGNIMSLLYGDSFENETTLSTSEIFVKLFSDYNEGLTCDVVSAKHLILPATILTDYCYSGMFYGCTSLTTAPELPAITLAESCYDCMFSGCTSLTIAPELLATTLASYCYAGMFNGCNALTTAPELPATTLAESCYSNMFAGCKSLTTAPELPAITLVDWCYSGMFYDCTALNYIKCLATDISATDCTTDWTYNVAASGTFVKGPRMSWSTGKSGILTGWTTDYSKAYFTTVITRNGTLTCTIFAEADTTWIESISYSINGADWVTFTNSDNRTEDEVITLNMTVGDKIRWKGIGTHLGDGNTRGVVFESSCFFNVCGNIMSLLFGDNFENITYLNSTYTYAFSNLFNTENICRIVDASNLILPANTLATNCYYSMFNGCTSLVTAPKLNAASLAAGCYGSMFRNCKSLTTAPELPATTLIQGCYNAMFYGCTSLITAPELPVTTLAISCYANMFNGCSRLTAAPELPAETMVDSCYAYMFQGCTSLNYIKCLATDISVANSTAGWLYGVSATGLFFKDYSMEDWTTGTSGIPSGWTTVDV